MMFQIKTTDNNCGIRLSKLLEGQTEDYSSALGSLRKIANIPLPELLEDNPGLLIYPPQSEDSQDKIEGSIFDLHGARKRQPHEKDFPAPAADDGETLTTNNVMGFIGIDDVRISIRSRFAQSDENDYFLHYMLMKVNHFNLVDYPFGQNEKEQGLDLLCLLFPAYLNAALKQGLFRTYQTYERNDAAIKGRIDIPRHIRQNIPFAGKVAYSSREHSADNHITQLVRHTIEHMNEHTSSRGILTATQEMREAVQLIRQATPTYVPRQRRGIVNKNLRPLQHPYFTAYAPLQALCMKILRHETLHYSENGDGKVHGILIDGAWLWEEYVWTVIQELKLGFKHPENKAKNGGKNIFDDGRWVIYPDFYNNNAVLDAKYKKVTTNDKDDPNFNVSRDDLFQIISYMHCLKLSTGGFIKPSDKEIDEKADKKVPRRTLKDYGGTIHQFVLEIAQGAKDFSNFAKQQKENEQKLQGNIKKSSLPASPAQQGNA